MTHQYLASFLISCCLFSASTLNATPFKEDQWTLNTKGADATCVFDKSTGQITTHTPIGTKEKPSYATLAWKGDFNFQTGDTVNMKFSMAQADKASVKFDLGGNTGTEKDAIMLDLFTDEKGNRSGTLYGGGSPSQSFDPGKGEMSFTFTKLADHKVRIDATCGNIPFQSIIIDNWVDSTKPLVRVSSSDKDKDNGNITFTSFDFIKGGGGGSPANEHNLRRIGANGASFTS
ncbi:MAG: hypothetical protein RR419_08820 [Akkermansia sp.]